MALLSAQVTLPMLSGIPTDVSVNSWAFDTGVGAATSTQLDEIEAQLGAFYVAVGPYLSPVLSGFIELKIYDIADPEPRAPIRFGTSPTPITTGTVPLPEEVAVCLSFRGQLVSGVPPARRRGRVYLGPLDASSIDQDEPGERVRPATAFIDEIEDAYLALRSNTASEGVIHVVWSRVNDDSAEVVFAWVDNALDTQRRRGVAPTTRRQVYPA